MFFLKSQRISNVKQEVHRKGMHSLCKENTDQIISLQKKKKNTEQIMIISLQKKGTPTKQFLCKKRKKEHWPDHFFAKKKHRTDNFFAKKEKKKRTLTRSAPPRLHHLFGALTCSNILILLNFQTFSYCSIFKHSHVAQFSNIFMLLNFQTFSIFLKSYSPLPNPPHPPPPPLPAYCSTHRTGSQISGPSLFVQFLVAAACSVNNQHFDQPKKLARTDISTMKSLLR